MKTMKLEKHESLPMYAVSEELAVKIVEYELQNNIQEMEEDGYTVIRNVTYPEFTDELRKAIIRCCEEDQGAYFGITKKGISSDRLLERDPVVAQACVNPKVLTMIEYMCGRAAQISQISGSVRYQGANAMGLHVDQAWIPAPFPAHNALMTACWYCDDTVDEASGATKVVPGSHRKMRHPSPAEVTAAEGAVPIKTPRGSVAMWDGRLWHANYPRTAAGERVLLHATYCRLAYRPLEDYGNLGQDFIDQYGPAMAELLGRNQWWGNKGWNNGAVDMSKYLWTQDASRR